MCWAKKMNLNFSANYVDWFLQRQSNIINEEKDISCASLKVAVSNYISFLCKWGNLANPDLEHFGKIIHRMMMLLSSLAIYGTTS